MNALLKRLPWSKPAGGALSVRPHRLVRPRTPGFQPGNTGSNPVGAIYRDAYRVSCIEYLSSVFRPLTFRFSIESFGDGICDFIGRGDRRGTDSAIVKVDRGSLGYNIIFTNQRALSLAPNMWRRPIEPLDYRKKDSD